MADFSRDPREHWLKPRFSKNEVANSGWTPGAPLALPALSLALLEQEVGTADAAD